MNGFDWFKFWGDDWLTDTKVIELSAVDRNCFLTIMCLANRENNNGKIKYCGENTIIKLTHLTPEEQEKATGIMQRLDDNAMITLVRNNSNNNIDFIVVNNFEKRQSRQQTGYERVKKCREKKRENRTLQNSVINDNERDNKMITSEKNRVEKKRKEKEKNIVQDDALRLSSVFFDLIVKNNDKSRLKNIPPKAKNKMIETWAFDIDKLNRIDGQSWEDIERVIRFVQSDDFERPNVQSGSKLRKRWDNLICKTDKTETNRRYPGLI